MGAVPRGLVADLVPRLGLQRGIETGTFKGEGTNILADTFPRVVTIELSRELYERARQALAKRGNVSVIHGSSPEVLRQLLEPTTPTFYFLDAHWSGGRTAGCERECPVLEELDAIASGHDDDVIVIDDARFFLAPPPAPHRPNQWPSIEQIVERLRMVSPSYDVTVVDDQVVAVPPGARAAVARWKRKVGSSESAGR